MFETFKGTVTPRDWMAVAVMLGITAGICAAYIFVVKSGLSTKAEVLDADIAMVQSDLAKAQEMAANLDALKEEMDKIQGLVTDFDLRLPTEAEIPNLVREFETLASGLHLSPNATQQNPIPNDAIGTEEYPFSVTTTGNFHETLTFINRLERSVRYLKVSRLTIEEEQDGASRATFTLSTFRFVENQRPVAAAQPGASS